MSTEPPEQTQKPPSTSQPQPQSQTTSNPPTSGPDSGPGPGPGPRPNLPTTTSSYSTQKTPVTLHPTSHLDPSAYVRGSNSITISSNVLIHPRAHLVSLTHPLTIGEGSIIYEKSILGGPITTVTPNPLSTATALPSSTSSTTTTTEIGRHVHIHGNVTINSGAKIGSFTVIEANVTIHHGVVVGRHCKICAGVDLVEDVPEWMVVYGGPGSGQKRRRRRRTMRGVGEEGAELAETLRLEALAKERDGTMAILRTAAAKSIAMKSKR